MTVFGQLQVMPVGHTAPHFNNILSCTTTESTCPVSIQPHLFRNGEIPTATTATGTPTSSNAFASLPEVIDFFAPPPFAHCEGHYEVPYETQQHPSSAEGLWYGPTGSCLEQMTQGPYHANWHDYATVNDYPNPFFYSINRSESLDDRL